MVKELQYTSIKRVLDNLTEHPLLRDLTLEQVVRYTIRFISIHGYPKLFEDKIADVEIKDFRGELPCDLVSIIQVKDLRTGVCLRSMTDNFAKGMVPKDKKRCHPKDLLNNVRSERFYRNLYIPPILEYGEEPAFKTQGRVIYTSFPKGIVGIAYKSIPVDEDGYPMIVDNENFLAALEAYIKKTVFTMKFDTGKVNMNVLQMAQRDYAWLAGQLESEFLQPSQSEMESLSRALNTLILRTTEFDDGFKHLGDREYLRKH
jgi:hypothetical protein